MKSVGVLLATLSITMIGVTAPALAWHPQGTITKTVRDITNGSSESTSGSSVNPGDTLEYAITVSNTAAPAANHDNDLAFVVMTDTLPSGVELSANATKQQITETIGTILPGQSVKKTYQVTVTDKTNADVLTNKACFTGNSVVKDNPQQGCAEASVTVTVPLVPTYSCDSLQVTSGSNLTATVANFTVSATNGAVFHDAVINWGDSTSPVTTNAVTGQTHQYPRTGSYPVTATAHFTVNGQDVSATSAGCTATALFTAPSAAPTLPNTGSGSVIVPTVLAAVTGYIVYYAAARRRVSVNR